MARYLTPAKIGLLALVELYTTTLIPHEAILPVLSFLTSHLVDLTPTATCPNKAGRWRKAESTVSLVISVKDFERLLSPHAEASGLPGRSLWDAFLSNLWAVNSFDALHEFVHRLPQLLAPSKEELRRLAQLEVLPRDCDVRLARNSPLGTFVRRCQTEFARLPLHHTAELWKDYVAYRQPTAQYMRRRHAGFARLSFDAVLLNGEHDHWDSGGVAALASVVYGDMLVSNENAALPVSTDDIESLLEFQINQMQSRCPPP